MNYYYSKLTIEENQECFDIRKKKQCKSGGFCERDI